MPIYGCVNCSCNANIVVVVPDTGGTRCMVECVTVFSYYIIFYFKLCDHHVTPLMVWLWYLSLSSQLVQGVVTTMVHVVPPATVVKNFDWPKLALTA